MGKFLNLRSLLSTLGVVFGVMAVVAMVAVGEGAKRETLDQIASMGLNNVILESNGDLKLRDVDRLQGQLHGTKQCIPIVTVDSSLPFKIKAVPESYFDASRIKVAKGRPLCSLDVARRKAVCVVGHDVALQVGMRSTLRIDNVDYQIVGTLDQVSHTDTVLLPLGSEGPLAKAHLSQVIIECEKNKAATLPPLISRLLPNREFHVVVPRALLAQAKRAQRTFNFVLLSIATISLLVGGIGIMNTMLASVTERTHEIGIRRAVGATKTDIKRQFLKEASLLTLTGGGIGIVAGCLIALAIKLVGCPTHITLWSIFLSCSMAGLVGLGSGLYPAMQAANMSPAAALRRN